jgi:hypothetical protein
VIRAEWIKFRTLPGRVVAVAAAVLVVVALGGLAAAGVQESCMSGDKEVQCPAPPVGPDGRAVDDRFTFAHRPLVGDGDFIAHVGAMTGTITYPPPGHDQIVAGLVPWAKAGIMVKAGTKPGDAYAAMLLTGHEGVRMQADFTGDRAVPGFSGGAWLRLRRTGDRVTGYTSADGTTWREVESVRLPGLPPTAQVGLFVTSPSNVTEAAGSHGGHVVQARFTQATAQFTGITPGGTFRSDLIGDDGNRTDLEKLSPPGVKESAGILTVTGSGDIAPLGGAGGMTVDSMLTGLAVAVLIMIVIAVGFGTAEYRRGLISTTFLASPRRERVVGAKALVVGGIAFAVGTVAAAVTVPLATAIFHAHAVIVLPTPWTTTLRVVLGTGALLSLAALLAYGIGTVTRRGLTAVVLAVILLIVPRVLTTVSLLPDAASEWLLRVTPAAGYAIQQTVPAYRQIARPYSPADGYYPLAPWAGLAVLAAWAVAVLALGVVRTRRADA